jgi:hypothetical protein
MTAPDSHTPSNRVPQTEPSRPGIKFVFCVILALVVVAIVIIRN